MHSKIRSEAFSEEKGGEVPCQMSLNKTLSSDAAQCAAGSLPMDLPLTSVKSEGDPLEEISKLVESDLFLK
jgi:hypothetical protein